MSKKEQSKASLTTAQIAKFQRLLFEKREEIVASVLSMESEALKRERTDLSNCPIHMGDVGSDTFEIENALSLANGERRLLAEIDEALERIEDGTYGICLGTGRAIGKARLEAIPWTRYCVEYADLLEKGQVSLDDGDQPPGPFQATAA